MTVTPLSIKAMALCLRIVAKTAMTCVLLSIGTIALAQTAIAPETIAPETIAPETIAPETIAPETTAPETTAPETTAPETTAPETTAPKTTAPKTTAPKTPPQIEAKDELRRILVKTIATADSFEDRFDAEVWLVSKAPQLERFVENPQERMKLLTKIHKAANQAGLQPEVVLAVIEVESHFDPYAVSRVGAQGIMQVMPFWKHEIGRPEDNLIDLDTNLKYGCTILKHYLNKSNGRLADALARYNGSYGRYNYVEKVMVAWQKNWR